MGLLKVFGARTTRFVTEEVHQSNLLDQDDWDRAVLGRLMERGATPESELRLNFYFCTNGRRKAKALGAELARLGYEVKCEPSALDPTQTVVSGKTAPLPMKKAAVSRWSSQMCELGFAHDCFFDGWTAWPQRRAA